MRRIAACLCAGALLVSGCVSAEAKRQLILSEANARRMVELIDQGATTREEEQAWIRAAAGHLTALRENLRLKAEAIR